MKILSTRFIMVIGFLSSRHLRHFFFFFKNNKSAVQNSKFVEEAILDLLRSGRIKESYMPPLVVTPLTVSENSCGKKCLILDLRYINQFVWKDGFKLDDWKTMMQYVKKGGYIFNFDLKSGYHHLDLFQSHQPYTGISFLFEGRVRYFFLHSFIFRIDVWALHIY